MKFNIFKTRGGSLRRKIHLELRNTTPSLENILKYVDEYESSNLATIDKLKRKRAVEMNRINGALKSTITAHGPITKVLIGSASKRIWGSLLEDPNSLSFFRRFLIKFKLS
jgi:hypothetical protein